jgi:hypothetical protein
MVLPKKIWKAIAALSALVLTPVCATPASAVTYLYAGYYTGYGDVQLVTDQGNLNPSEGGFAYDYGGGSGSGVSSGWAPMIADWNGPGLGSIVNFFVYDVSSLAGPVSHASLKLQGFGYSDTSQIIGLNIFDATPLALNASLASISDGAAFMSALTQGAKIGNTSFNWLDLGNASEPWLTVNFNSTGIAALNSAIGSESKVFAMGASVSPVAPAPLAGTGMLAALAAAIGFMATRGGSLVRSLRIFRKLGTA